MKITNIKVTESETHNVLSGSCDEFELYYKFPKEISPTLSADPFIAACLIPSMLLGTDITLDDNIPVSPKLLNNIKILQEVFYCWSKHLNKNFKKINITGGTPTVAKPCTNKVMSFFSGGVDGTYTFLKNEKQIDMLMFAKGIDMQLTSDDLFNDALNRNTNYLKQKGKQLTSIETNVRFLGHQYGISWNICFGGGLASIALAAGVKKCFIASGLSYADTQPEGSNPLTDRLWSNECTELVHDGAEAQRIEKVKYISKDQEAMKILRVCWHDKGYNCGECEKCLRTMSSLRALKLSAPTFPVLSDQLIKTKLAKLKLYDPHDLTFLNETLKMAKNNNDVVLTKGLLKIKKSYEIRQIGKKIDSLFFGAILKQLKKTLSKI